MPSRKIALCIDANDVDSIREFWVEALGYEATRSDEGYRWAVPVDGSAGALGGVMLVFQQVDDAQTAAKNRLHIDIAVGDHVQSEADRLVAIGATQVSERFIEVGNEWIVMADPEGNEFCLVRV